MAKPDYEKAKAYAVRRLSQELPSTAYYHCAQHTLGDVLPAAVRLAEAEGVHGDDLLCLLTAACFHDIGHIERSNGHEEISARIASEVLPRFGYSPEQIRRINTLIMATKVPQHPSTLLEKIIVDADMDSLGRDDFLRVSRALRDELAAAGVYYSDEDWYQYQINFLTEHRYFTQAARDLRDEGKQRNLALLRRLLEECRNEK